MIGMFGGDILVSKLYGKPEPLTPEMKGMFGGDILVWNGNMQSQASGSRSSRKQFMPDAKKNAIAGKGRACFRNGFPRL
jgi:hypothetical protein